MDKNKTTPAAKTVTPAPAVAPTPVVVEKVDPKVTMLAGLNRILDAKKVAAKFASIEEPIVLAVPADLSAFITGVSLKTKTQKDGAVLVLWSATFADNSEKTMRIGWVKQTKAGKLGWHVDEVRVRAPSGVIG